MTEFITGLLCVDRHAKLHEDIPALIEFFGEVPALIAFEGLYAYVWCCCYQEPLTCSADQLFKVFGKFLRLPLPCLVLHSLLFSVFSFSHTHTLPLQYALLFLHAGFPLVFRSLPLFVSRFVG